MPRRLDTTAEPATVDLYEVEVTVPRGQAVTLAVGFGVLVALFVGGQAASSDLAWWAVPLRAVWRGAQAGAGLFVALFLVHAVSERVARARARGPVREPPADDWHVESETEPRKWAVTGVVSTPDGRRQVWARYEMERPGAWHEFCKAVEAGRNFSETEAQRHEVHPSDWAAVKDDFERRGWYVLAKRRGTPDLRGAGKALVKGWATTPPARVE